MRRAVAEAPELPGHTFVRALGSGGFSDVFLYEQKLPRRRVAVKVLISDEVTAASRAAFVGEANSMAQLSAHPYIVSIFHADVASDGRPYFVMEYCSGPSLAERYKRERFTVADTLRTGVRLSSAIATAHAAGILHRDIKPANVLTNDYGWPALTDFGISSAVEDDSLPVHTTTNVNALEDAAATGGESVGMSVPWSPPEMFEDDPQPDVRSDVFSLAATIYTILAGFTPFEVRGRSNGTLDLIGRIERGAITPLTRDDVPRSLVAVLRKGMETDRADRFDSAVDFARALQRVELELGYSATAIDVPNLDVAPMPREAEGDDGDSTRVRSVAVVDAQPAVKPQGGDRMIRPPSFGAAPAAGPPAAAQPPQGGAAETVVRRTTSVDAQPEQTVVRSAKSVAAQPEPAVSDQTVVRSRVSTPQPASAESPEPASSAEEATAELGSRTNRLVILIAAGVVAVLAIAITLSLTVFGTPTGPDTTQPTAEPDGPVVLDQVETPVIASVTPEGTDLVFTVENPDPEEGDIFIWKRAGLTSDEPSRSNEDGRIVVPEYTAGQTVCVSVSIVRSGRESANPLEQCYP